MYNKCVLSKPLYVQIRHIVVSHFPCHFTSSYLYLGRDLISARPLVGLLLAFFLKLNFIDYFFLNNLFKIYLICLVFLSFYNLLSKILSKYPENFKNCKLPIKLQYSVNFLAISHSAWLHKRRAMSQ